MDVASPFVPGTDVRVEGTPDGTLSGLTFAAKDLFDVAGHITGGGNPDWAGAHPVPTRHAWAVQTLLDAGATLIGKTITDEISLGILGDSPWFGTPMNPAAPGRMPGGSSSGSAVAVASGSCDLALGTDTGGSVRVPASYCGLFGIRPTHGRLSLAGMLPQAPSSDTTGWFARDAAVFARVSEVMLGEAVPDHRPAPLVIAADAFAFADPAVSEALAPMLDRLVTMMSATEERSMAPAGFATWARAQRTLQPHEAWLTFSDWIDRCNPRLAFGVARNLAAAAATPAGELQWAGQVRNDARARMRRLLRDSAVLCMPTTPSEAPPTVLSLAEQGPVRDRITCLACHGGLTGVPQVSVPGSTVNGRPVGLSLIAAPGEDVRLVALARALSGGAA